MNDKSRARKRHLAGIAATAAASLLFAAPLAASAQTSAAPSDDQVTAIRSLTYQAFDDMHSGNLSDFASISTPDFAVTNPDGSTMGAPDLFARSMTNYMTEGNYQREIAVNSVTTDGTNITEQVSVNTYSAPILSGDVTDTAQSMTTSTRTLTWTPSPDGTWLLASEQINSFDRTNS